MLIADILMPHTVEVERFVGVTATGRKYDPPTAVRAFVDDTQKLVRDAQGAEVVSSTTVFLDAGQYAPPGSKVTVWKGTARARTAIVLAASGASNAFLGHTELNLE